MEQYKIVEAVSEKIISEEKCEAIYLLGEIARQEHDQFSDVDLLVLVALKNYDRFLDERLRYAEEYQPVLFHKYEFRTYPVLLCVYENGHRLNLYAANDQNFIQTGDYYTIYDPKKKLAEYEKILLNLAAAEIKELLDAFSLRAKEYHVAAKRSDDIHAFSLATALFDLFGTLFRIGYDAENAKMGMKNLLKKADYESRKTVREIATFLNLERHADAVRLMYVALDRLLGSFPLKIVEMLNFDFYTHTKNLIMSI